MPGHVRFGEGHEPGTDPWAKARAKEAAAKKAFLEKKAKAAKDAAELKKELEESEQNVQLDSQLEWTKRKKMVPRRIIDADGDGVEDNRDVGRAWLDRFEEDVYGYYIDDIHNTQNGAMPGHDRWGDDPVPTNRWNPFKPAEYIDQTPAKAPGQAQMEEAAETAPPAIEALQLANQWKPREKRAPRRLIDADGDGVEDNREVSRKILDKIEADVYGYSIDDIHNTQNGEMPGHDRWGEFPVPTHHWTTPFADRMKEAPEYQVMLQSNESEAILHNYIGLVNGPEDLVNLGFSADYRPFKAKAIYDVDGDGVEDNMKMTSDQLDNFYKPNVFGAPIEHIYNTRHGNLPGERNKWFYDK